MKLQPARYTEFDLADRRHKVMVPFCENPCSTCEHAEPFGDAVMVMWCSKHESHLPAGASCPQWSPPPYEPS